ncbi:MAG: Spy/CpxP family protein refolding chaperone [Spirochaetia bacterium]|nr:Spy/CpxP family protein refolding chaperone [Spirochaetota bacterium]MCX8096966.1 Spy/CpxP family protein refolding chaperone [Spirochaetota bacterium]MDW8111951.1 Spy/CpxP family protein refolding chaperone [Spirochaetia bacterium]
MREIYKIVSLIVAATIFLLPAAFSEPPDAYYMHFGKGKHEKYHFDFSIHKLMKILHFSKELNLSSDQQDRIFNIILQTKQRNDNISTDIMKLKYDISKEMSKQQPDFNRVKSLNSQITRLENDFELNIKNSLADILSILTPEQREKLKDLSPSRRFMGRDLKQQDR